MTPDFVAVNKPWVTEADIDYVRRAMESSWISGEGPYVQEFEEVFADSVGRKHGISVSNGTIALDLVIAALNIGPGDEVILPSFTIISCLSQILRSGATPVFVDSDPDTWNMDVAEVEARISSKTRAILAVHIYGLPVDMDPLSKLGNKYGVLVIEDAAEAHGLLYKNRRAGSLGLVSTFSFYANKNITTGEGGMILTDDDELAARLRELKNLGFRPPRRFVHYELAWNGRLSSMQAALGTSQTKRLDQIVQRRRQLGQRYRDAFSDLDALQLPCASTDYAKNNYWVFGLVLSEKVGFDAREAMEKLENIGIGTRPFFYPLHLQPLLEKYGLGLQEPLPVSERLGTMGFYIPNGLGISEPEIVKVIDAVRDTFD